MLLGRGHVPPCSSAGTGEGASCTPLPLSAAVSALPTAPLHWFSSNRCHPCTAVPGIPLLGSSVAVQDSAGDAVPLQSLPSLGVHLLWEGRESFPQAQRAQPGHRPPAHLQTPSAKCCFQLEFLLCYPSVPLPDNSSYFIACL